MNPLSDAILRSWNLDPWLIAALGLPAVVYLRGWRELQRRDPRRWTFFRLAAFLSGLTAIFLALASPVEPFAAFWLQAHMLQHLLLMMVAPPLLWLGWPLMPLLRGLPAPLRRHVAAPLLRSPALRKLFQGLTHPLVAWPLFVGATWFWHTPAFYQLALRSSAWHEFEHFCFFATALLFWFPVVRPYPSRPRWSPWLLFPYLLLADVQNTVLAALLTFSDHVLYPHYLQVPRLGGLSALDDQAAAGVIMWVPGSVAFLLPLFAIGIGMLWRRPRTRPAKVVQPRTLPASDPLLPILPASGRREPAAPAFDLLRLPGIGPLLRWRHARLVFQLPLLLIAGVVIWDGLNGPNVAPMNLAGVLPWIHWRGLLILGLLAVGNLFCMACPFTLPRAAARRWLPSARAWPRWLRSKWLAVVLVLLFLWSYEAFALWDRPLWTAWITIGYFVAAFAVDGVFRGAAFCKYVCPIGQFNFVQSLVSPFEIKVRAADVCASCTTKDCIRGNASVPGCQLALFLPRKSSNLDCTWCLDCVHACPHENVGILAVVPGQVLWQDRLRSGVGRFAARPDLAALVMLLAFGAFANAAGMVGPIVAWQEQLRARCGSPPWLAVTTIFYLFALILLPLTAMFGAAALSRRGNSLSLAQEATRYAYTLVPLGFAMWIAHYSFHFFTSYETIVPTAQRFAADLGLPLGAPAWQCACCRPATAGLLRFEILLLDLGLLLSLYTAWRIAASPAANSRAALRAATPWAVLLLALFALGIWIIFQPMQMRGTLG